MSASSRIDDVLNALSDPKRRGAIDLLRKRKLRAGELADRLDVSPQVMSRHLKILRYAGLIEDDDVEGDARVKLYALRDTAFRPLRNWLDEVEAMWSEQLDAFKTHAESKSRKPRA